MNYKKIISLLLIIWCCISTYSFIYIVNLENEAIIETENQNYSEKQIKSSNNAIKQRNIRNWVDEHRNDGNNGWPTEVILGLIAIEGTQCAFVSYGPEHCTDYNWEKYGEYAEPDNTNLYPGKEFFSDGIMQVTPSSTYNGYSGYGYIDASENTRIGGYINKEIGYEAGIDDGIAYLDHLYDQPNGRGYLNAILHYNSGPDTIYTYMGKNPVGPGNKEYLEDLAITLDTFIPQIYGESFRNQAWIDALRVGQEIVNEMLEKAPDDEDLTREDYKDLQDELDRKLRNIILFDDTHDTDNDELIGNYVDLKTTIEEKGYKIIESNTGLLTSDALKPYGILILPDLELELSREEIQGVLDYLNRGGRALIIGEWGPAHLPGTVSKISAIMDIYFQHTIVYDPDNNHNQTENCPIIHKVDRSHEIGKSINEFAMYRGSSLFLTPSSPFPKIIARGDTNTYTEWTLDPLPPPFPPPPPPPYGEDVIVLACSQIPSSGGEAKLVCIGDSDLWKTRTEQEPPNYKPINDYNNKKLLENVIDWLTDAVPPPPTKSPGFGMIIQEEIKSSTISIVEGASELRIELTWLGSDLDLGVQHQSGSYVGYDPFTHEVRIDINGAEYSNIDSKPEWIKIPNPEPGDWVINVYGRAIPEEYELYRVYVPDTFPPAAITDLSLVNYTLDSITLEWTAPGDDGNKGKGYTYDIRYSTEPITEENWDDAIPCEGEPIPQLAGSKESYVVTDLIPGETYYFAIKTSDDVPNLSKLSNIAEGSTWNYMFEDCKRNTKLYINTHKKIFQFITEDNNYKIKIAMFMCEFSRKILILHKDEEIILTAQVIDRRKDFCIALAIDTQTCKKYL
ncbi:MAG: fibronectin type III domain-containing protein [Candidatus Odinarchaeota archaeon]